MLPPPPPTPSASSAEDVLASPLEPNSASSPNMKIRARAHRPESSSVSTTSSPSSSASQTTTPTTTSTSSSFHALATIGSAPTSFPVATTASNSKGSLSPLATKLLIGLFCGLGGIFILVGIYWFIWRPHQTHKRARKEERGLLKLYLPTPIEDPENKLSKTDDEREVGKWRVYDPERGSGIWREKASASFRSSVTSFEDVYNGYGEEEKEREYDESASFMRHGNNSDASLKHHHSNGSRVSLGRNFEREVVPVEGSPSRRPRTLSDAGSRPPSRSQSTVMDASPRSRPQSVVMEGGGRPYLATHGRMVSDTSNISRQPSTENGHRLTRPLNPRRQSSGMTVVLANAPPPGLDPAQRPFPKGSPSPPNNWRESLVEHGRTASEGSAVPHHVRRSSAGGGSLGETVVQPRSRTSSAASQQGCPRPSSFVEGATRYPAWGTPQPSSNADRRVSRGSESTFGPSGQATESAPLPTGAQPRPRTRSTSSQHQHQPHSRPNSFLEDASRYPVWDPSSAESSHILGRRVSREIAGGSSTSEGISMGRARTASIASQQRFVSPDININ